MKTRGRSAPNKNLKTTPAKQPKSSKKGGGTRGTREGSSSWDIKEEEASLLQEQQSEQSGTTGTVGRSRGLPHHICKELANDIEAAGGIHNFDRWNSRACEQLCNTKPLSYGASNSALRRQIQNKVAYWKSFSKSQYKEKVLFAFGIVPLDDREGKQDKPPSAKKKKPPVASVFNERDSESDISTVTDDDQPDPVRVQLYQPADPMALQGGSKSASCSHMLCPCIISYLLSCLFAVCCKSPHQGGHHKPRE
jgi:hypothetical protein